MIAIVCIPCLVKRQKTRRQSRMRICLKRRSAQRISIFNFSLKYSSQSISDKERAAFKQRPLIAVAAKTAMAGKKNGTKQQNELTRFLRSPLQDGLGLIYNLSCCCCAARRWRYSSSLV